MNAAHTLRARVRRDNDALARIMHAAGRHGAAIVRLTLHPCQDTADAWTLDATLHAGEACADRVRRQLTRIAGVDQVSITLGPCDTSQLVGIHHDPSETT